MKWIVTLTSRAELQLYDAALWWSASRGAQIGATFGEAFTQYKGHPYPNNNLLREVLDFIPNP